MSSRPLRPSLSWQTLIERDPMSTPTRLFPSAMWNGSVAPSARPSQKSALHKGAEVVPKAEGLMRRCFAVLIFALSSSAAELWADPPHEPTYVVKDGDTLSGIASRHSVSVEALVALNRLDKDKPLKLGKTLTLPAPNLEGRGGGPMAAGKQANLGSSSGVRAGVVRLVRGQETLQLRVLDHRGRLVSNTLPEFTRFLRFPDGSTH